MTDAQKKVARLKSYTIPLDKNIKLNCCRSCGAIFVSKICPVCTVSVIMTVITQNNNKQLEEDIALLEAIDKKLLQFQNGKRNEPARSKVIQCVTCVHNNPEDCLGMEGDVQPWTICDTASLVYLTSILGLL